MFSTDYPTKRQDFINQENNINNRISITEKDFSEINKEISKALIQLKKEKDLEEYIQNKYTGKEERDSNSNDVEYDCLSSHGESKISVCFFQQKSNNFFQNRNIDDLEKINYNRNQYHQSFNIHYPRYNLSNITPLNLISNQDSIKSFNKNGLSNQKVIVGNRNKINFDKSKTRLYEEEKPIYNIYKGTNCRYFNNPNFINPKNKYVDLSEFFQNKICQNYHLKIFNKNIISNCI